MPVASDDLERVVAGVASRHPCISAAWLFGSTVDGSTGPLSDVDVGVLGCAGLSFDELAQLTAEVSQAVGRASDVVVVERASPVLAMEIASGARCYARDGAAADAWEDLALRRYLGTAHLRRIVHGHLRDDLLGPPR